MGDAEVLKNIIKRVRFYLPFPFPFSLKKKIPEILLSLKEEDLLQMERTQDKFCHQCGQCCSETSFVDISRSELNKISKFLRVTTQYLTETFQITKTKSHLRIPADPCPFYRDLECFVYPVRPQVCSTYPMGAVLKRFRENKPFILSNCPGLVDVMVDFIIGKIEDQVIHREVYYTP